ncbi:bifunctional adenosylcobinamide kinase/adenosylcobinamide-phosphate guanylyltransferase [Nocardioides pacificus]
MTVRLLGTGAADGWPNPFCTCASCTAERVSGRTRAQTAALVDDVLLIDCGPETPSAATRHGVALDRLRFVLFTHQHTDHCSPAFLLHRSWVHDGPLTVVGPPDVIEACRPWLADDTEVRFVAVAPGDTLDLDGYDVRVLASSHVTGLGRDGAPDAVLYAVRTPSGRSLLHATDTGPLPEETVEALRDAALETVLMEQTFGDRTDLSGTGHLDLTTFPEQLRRLREVGATTTATEVVAVHLSHHNPPTPELARRLADWGVRVVDDGTLLDPVTRAAPDHLGPLRTLVTGGARSGKSQEAERLLAGSAQVLYVATSYPVRHDGDAEWAERVRLHRERRPAHWETVETLDLAGLLRTPGAPLLVDCLTLWLTRVMDAHDAWSDDAWPSAEKAVLAEVDELVDAWRSTARRVVAVTNEVGQGVVPDTAAGRRFRDLMGILNARVAAATEDVRWCVAGRVVHL